MKKILIILALVLGVVLQGGSAQADKPDAPRFIDGVPVATPQTENFDGTQTCTYTYSTYPTTPSKHWGPGSTWPVVIWSTATEVARMQLIYGLAMSNNCADRIRAIGNLRCDDKTKVGVWGINCGTEGWINLLIEGPERYEEMAHTVVDVDSTGPDGVTSVYGAYVDLSYEKWVAEYERWTFSVRAKKYYEYDFYLGTAAWLPR